MSTPPGPESRDGPPRALVRPYTLTGGRTAAADSWPPETVVSATARVPSPRTPAPSRPADGRDLPDGDLRRLADHVRGPVWLPGDPGFAEEIASSYSSVAHRPRVLVGARDPGDVAAAVSFAVERGLPVAVQATGHGAVRPVDDGVMLSTRRMRTLRVDPDARTATVGAGVVWSEVIAAAARHGLAPLCGSAPAVGVVGYTLGGGISPLARTFGFTADHVVAAEVVTADGHVRPADEAHEPELFWGLRGGKGNLGVVTALVVRLFPITSLVGGGLFFDGDAADAVLRAYPGWTAGLSEATTTSVSLSHLGRRNRAGGRSPTVHLRFAHVGPPEAAAEILAPMRALVPALDTVGELPFEAIGTIHDDPTEPADVWKRGLLLGDLPPGVVETVLRTAGPDATDPVAGIEIRHLGGAMARRPQPDNAVGGRDARYGVFIVDAHGADGGAPERGRRLVEALEPHSTGATVNFLGTVTDSDVVATAWTREDYRRLRALKARVDPDEVFRFGYAVPALADDRPDDDAGLDTGPPEARAILEAARPWRSLAEIAAGTRLPLGVVRVLVTDLADAGHVRVHRPGAGADTDQLERALRGLQRRI
ncbi:FAD-binding protein [Actinomycetospora endophytica]|uniref:FAD-binding protein n=1 Tax=Actinomycetospora endophytica TaxID=2291215 RepID=A0ABS8PGP1_9PSEU|nr:FAD-binding protein [Actinomycetospora endophytica]MCD2197388.1 FAD-binding protein [Actinomycetospora endophytica]